MAVNRRKTKEQQCEPGFHLSPAFPEEAGLFHALTPEEDEVMGTAGHDQQLWQEDHPVGKIAFASGEEEIFTDPQKYLDAVREELPFMTTTGFRYQTLTKDPRVRKAVDDILLDFAGEENSFKLEDYGLTEEGKKALRDAADPNLTHTYNWYVITNCGSPKEQIQQDMTMEEAIRVYQDTDEKEKRLGVTKDEIATVDLVRLADHEQRFFEDYQVMDCFKDDPVILQAVQTLHQALGEENPVQGMTMGGM